MFNRRYKDCLRQFLSLHGFQAVDKGVYVRVFDFANHPRIEVHIKNKVRIICATTQRSRSEVWEYREYPMITMIVENEILIYKNCEAIYRAAAESAELKAA